MCIRDRFRPAEDRIEDGVYWQDILARVSAVHSRLQAAGLSLIHISVAERRGTACIEKAIRFS